MKWVYPTDVNGLSNAECNSGIKYRCVIYLQKDSSICRKIHPFINWSDGKLRAIPHSNYLGIEWLNCLQRDVLSTGFVHDYNVIYKATNQNDLMYLHEDRQAIAKYVNELQLQNQDEIETVKLNTFWMITNNVAKLMDMAVSCQKIIQRLW